MMNEQFKVEPTRPVAPYFGGKRNLASTLIPMIDGAGAGLYAEPFVGMGGVFLRRRVRAKSEVINDLSKDVSGLFRILQRHFQQFMDVLKWQITSRAEFERLLQVDPETLTDLERAARFLYLQRTSYGAKVVGRTFGTSATGSARFDVTKLQSMLEGVHERLAGVVVERLHFAECLARYDRDHSLFYLDPPYWGCEGDYGKDLFGRPDFELLSKALQGLQGRFVLSINDTPEIRDLFSWADLKPVRVRYTVAGGAGSHFGELIIASPGAGLLPA